MTTRHNWFQERRLDFIEDRVLAIGKLQRADLMNYFGISMPQATKDIALYSKANKRLIYDRQAKCYVLKAGRDGRSLAVRGSTPERRSAWMVF